ncbi:MAG: NAD(P)/FAD-dependent oxidoreductase [Desulfurococcales archaeon]|nr:NAD(P)/FAD-dependent oxidoreductase [Desulfurococcales archaeon]
MAGPDYLVVGAGPAGAALAWSLARKGYEVLVAEASPKPGSKPCGRGIPDTGDLKVPLPGECVVSSVRGAELYVDNEHVFTIEGIRGSIVDRTCLVEALIADGGADLVTRAYYKPAKNIVRAGARTIDAPPPKTVIAGGHPFYPGEKIDAVQYIVEGEWQDKLTILFDTRLIGYYWIFPSTPGTVEVGVGGYEPAPKLFERLDKFVSSHLLAQPLRNKRVLRREGARIAVGGVMRSLLSKHPIHIGEAAGFVYPLTGEGIRPSIMSAVQLAERLASGDSPAGITRKDPARAIGLQRRILARVKRMRPEERAELLKSVPEDVHIKIALGKGTLLDLLKVLARKPWLAAKLGLG